MHIGTKFPGYGDSGVWGTNAAGKSNGYAFWDDIIFAKEGATSKLVWDTESGDLTDVNYGHYNPWTDQIMSDHMAQEFYVWSSRAYSGPKIWFLLHDDQSSGNDIWIQHAGLYHTDLTPKPLPLATFQQLSGIADTVKPVTEILVIGGASPVDGQVVSGQILLSASGSDNVTPQSQLVVRYYVDNVLVGTADVTVYGYIFTLDTTTLSNGVHTIVSKATDLASNVGVSTGHIVNVQNTGVDLVPPSCSWVSIGGQTPVNGLAIVGQQVQLVASVSDNVTPTDQIVVDFLVGNIVIGVATPPFTGGQAKYTWNSTGIPNGSVTMVARARDLANNVRNSDVISVYINNPVLKVPVPNQALVRFRTDSGDPVIGRPFGVGWSRREKRDGKTRGIILCHPYGDNGWGIFNSAAGGFDQLVLRPIINAGYTVICPQNGDGNASAPSGGQWGNDTAIASLTAARTWLQDSTKGAARPGRFAILCFSMGGAAAWNLARNLGTPTPVAGIISIDAATDLSWVRGTDQGHWKNFTVAAGTTTTIIRSSAAFFQSYMVGWQFSYPYGTGNLTARISAYTSSTQVSVTPPTQGVIANGVQPIVTPADGAGIFYQNINQAYGGNGADPDGVMNDAAWNAIKGTRDPALMVDTRSWMLDIPWFSSYGELDTFIGGSPQQKKLGNKLHYTNYSIDSAGIHGGIYVKAEDLITFLNGLDWQ
jgi:pimeloyl-ACP methyl ester carboxylesterase